MTAIVTPLESGTLRLQIAQCRSYLKILGPNVGIIYEHGALGVGFRIWGLGFRV